VDQQTSQRIVGLLVWQVFDFRCAWVRCFFFRKGILAETTSRAVVVRTPAKLTLGAIGISKIALGTIFSAFKTAGRTITEITARAAITEFFAWTAVTKLPARGSFTKVTARAAITKIALRAVTEFTARRSVAKLSARRTVTEIPAGRSITEITAWATIFSEVAFRTVETTITASVSRRAV